VWWGGGRGSLPRAVPTPRIVPPSFQAACFAARLSCATPLIAPTFGALGVALSSALAGQASLRVRRATRADGRDPPPRMWRKADVVCDAVMGVVLFRAMGGRYRALLPSDLVKPGACAVESLPAPGSQYATDVAKGELARLMRRWVAGVGWVEGWAGFPARRPRAPTRAPPPPSPPSDGCHHCGSRHGRVIGDHIPPNKVVFGGAAANGGGGPGRRPLAPTSAAAAVAQFIATSARTQPKGGAYWRGRSASGGGAVGAALDAAWSVGSLVARSAGLAAGRGAGRARPRPRPTRAVRQWIARQRVTLAWRAREAVGLNPTRQRYYPQCRPCSQLQAVAVRTERLTLKAHAAGPRPWHFSGVLTGLRHYQEPRGRGAAPAGGDDNVLEELRAAVQRLQEGGR
jgi:hypothetical protein